MISLLVCASRATTCRLRKRISSGLLPSLIRSPCIWIKDAAAKTLFKGLAASGWHTAAIAMNLAVQIRPFGPHPLIGMGVDGLRWMLPVRPNDVLHLEGEVMSLTPSKTKPQGIALVKWTLYNQNGEEVYTFTPIAIVPRRSRG
jgi:acyl dehydratase